MDSARRVTPVTSSRRLIHPVMASATPIRQTLRPQTGIQSNDRPLPKPPVSHPSTACPDLVSRLTCASCIPGSVTHTACPYRCTQPSPQSSRTAKVSHSSEGTEINIKGMRLPFTPTPHINSSSQPQVLLCKSRSTLEGLPHHLMSTTITVLFLAENSSIQL